jgi:hypothetical protein
VIRSFEVTYEDVKENEREGKALSNYDDSLSFRVGDLNVELRVVDAGNGWQRV